MIFLFLLKQIFKDKVQLNLSLRWIFTYFFSLPFAISKLIVSLHRFNRKAIDSDK